MKIDMQSGRGPKGESTDIAPKSFSDIRDFILEEVGKALKLSPGSIDPDRSLFALGVDSFASIVITGALSDRFGIAIPPSFIYKYKSVNKLAQKIESALKN